MTPEQRASGEDERSQQPGKGGDLTGVTVDTPAALGEEPRVRSKGLTRR